MTKVQKLNLKDKVDDGEMDLSLCEIQEVPVKDIAVYKKVYSLDLSNNSLLSLPKNFAILTNILKLDLSRNKLKELPDNFGGLIRLKHLDLYKNDLKHLPLSFAELKNLKWLDLKDNPLIPAIQSAAGQCLDTKQCQQCASDVVAFYKDVKERVEEEKKKAELDNKNKNDSDAVKAKSSKKAPKKGPPKQVEGKVDLVEPEPVIEEQEQQFQPPTQEHIEKFDAKMLIIKILLLLFIILFTLTAVKYKNTQFIEDTIKSSWHGFFKRTPGIIQLGGEAAGNLVKTIHDGYGFVLIKFVDNQSIHYISTKFRKLYGH